MGRTLYSSATMNYLISQAGLDGNAAIKGAGVPGSIADEHKPIATQAPSTSRAGGKDAPWTWSQRRFDPDDESMPVVDERFVGLDESLRPDDVSEEDEDEEEDTASDDDEEEDDDNREESGRTFVMEDVYPANAGDRSEDTGSSMVEAGDLAHPQSAEGMSPSAGVFHTHTLPFNLPAAGSLSRRSSAAHSVTASSGTVSRAVDISASH